MATLLEIAELALNKRENQVEMRLLGGLTTVALEVYAESEATPNHAARLALAVRIMSDPNLGALTLSWRFALANSLSGVAFNDTNILNAIRARWDLMSAATAISQ